MNKPASRTFSFAASAVTDADGVLTARATLTTAESLTAGDLNGAVMLAGGALAPSRSLTITRALATGAYTTDPVVITGRRGGSVQTFTYTPPDADGGDTAHSGVLFDALSAVAFPAQQTTGGSWTVGTRDLAAQAGEKLRGFKLVAAGLVTVAYDEAATLVDTLDADTSLYEVAPMRIAAEELTVGLTVFV